MNTLDRTQRTIIFLIIAFLWFIFAATFPVISLVISVAGLLLSGLYFINSRLIPTRVMKYIIRMSDEKEFMIWTMGISIFSIIELFT